MNKGLKYGLIVVASLVVLLGIFLITNYNWTPEGDSGTDYNNLQKYESYDNYVQGECMDNGSYCIYKNREPFLYEDPKEEIPQEYLISYPESKKFIDRVENDGVYEDVCVKSGEPYVSVDLFHKLYPDSERVVGLGYGRTVLICQDKYFISEYHDYGPELYGPFDREMLVY